MLSCDEPTLSDSNRIICALSSIFTIKENLLSLCTPQVLFPIPRVLKIAIEIKNLKNLGSYFCGFNDYRARKVPNDTKA